MNDTVNDPMDDSATKPVESNAHGRAGSDFLRRLIRRTMLLAMVAIGGLFLLSFTSRVPKGIGPVNGRLAECPQTPNCVATLTDQNDKQMDPIPLLAAPPEAIDQIKAVVAEHFPRARLVRETNNYLHFEFVSLLFRFVDDVEFLVDDNRKEINFRSASRVGHSDLEANRRRMEKIVTELIP